MFRRNPMMRPGFRVESTPPHGQGAEASEGPKGSEKTINVYALYWVARFMDPLVRSALFFHSWALYFLIKLLKARFSLYRLGSQSLFLSFLKVNMANRSAVVRLYLLQVFLFTVLLLAFSKYMSGGASMPRKLLKNTNLSNKVAIVTGGYDGIGYETVLQLLKWNCKVVIMGRNPDKAKVALQKLQNNFHVNPDNVSFVKMDLDDLKSVKSAVDQFKRGHKRLDFLVNNAGVYFRDTTITKSNLEANFSSNFLGHFYLTSLLLDVLKSSEGRVINVSSIAHFRYDPNLDPLFETKKTDKLEVSPNNTYYGRSKLFNIWFTLSLQRKLSQEKARVGCFSLMPGVVRTKLVWPLRKSHIMFLPHFIGYFMLKTPREGAQTTLFLCASELSSLLPGAYYSDCDVGIVSVHAQAREFEDKLYNLASEMVDRLTK